MISPWLVHRWRSAGSKRGSADTGRLSADWRRSANRPVYRVCRLCQKPLYSPTALSFHMDMHRGRTTCTVCGRVLVSRQKLSLHMQRLHGTSPEQQQQQQQWHRQQLINREQDNQQQQQSQPTLGQQQQHNPQQRQLKEEPI